METVQDTIDRVRKQLNSNILSELEGISLGNTPEETLAAIQSAPVQEAIMSQAQGGSLVGDTLGAFGIGAGSMLNNSITGGVGLALGGLGRITEAISPFSGWDNDTLTHLANLGMTSAEAYEQSPYRDSWLTSAAKGTLAVHNAFEDAINDLRTQVLGSDPSNLAKIFEGSGSSMGFLLAGALMGGNPITKAIWAGVSEALSEAGGFMGNAYRKGLYDKGALGAAGKNFLANAALNSLLNVTVGRFSPHVEAIANPYTRWAVGGVHELINELLQEPSQQLIEQATMNSLENGSDFLPELGQSFKQWPETFMQTAPETALSTVLTQLLLGPGNPGSMYTKKGRRDIAREAILSHYDTVVDNEGNRKLKAHQGNMEEMRQDFATDLTAQKSSLQDIINGIYQSGNEEIDTNPDLMGDVQRNFAKINTIDEQLEALKNFGKQAEIQNTVDDVQNTLDNQDVDTQKEGSVPKQTTEDLQRTPPEQNTLNNEQEQELSKPKKRRKKKNTATQAENTQDLSNNAVEEDEDNLPEFTPTEDTVKNYKAKNVAGSNTARITTAARTEVDVRYRIVDADDLIASTTETGAPNPNYLQELQPRQRDKITSLEQIDRISRNLDPELLGANRMASDGAPVIGSDMMVESGNGRVLGIKKAYKYGMAEHYRDYLRQNAEMFGLTPEDVDSVKNPVLVRERLTDVDRVKFTSEANESSLATMSASENALDDAKKITLDMFNSYDYDKEFADNRDFIRAVISVLPKNERGNLLQADGNISRDGFERVKYAMAAKAYNSDSILRRLSELLDDEVTNISKALVHVSPAIAKLEAKIEQGHTRKDLSLRDDIMQAVNQFVNVKKQKKRISDWLAQPALFEEENEPPVVKMLMEFFDKNIRAYRRISDGLLRYVELALQQAENREQVLFEDSIRSKEDMLEEALFHATGEYDEITNTAEKRKKNKTSSENSNTSPTRDDIYNSNFKRWFGDWEKKPQKASKVVDENGLPLIVYHGTDAKSENGEPPFTEFDTKGTTKGMHGNTAGTGAWFHSSRKAAQSYGSYVYDVYLNIRNPYIYDCTGKNIKTIAKKKDQIVRDVRAGKYGEGYDGVIFRNIEDVLLYFGFSSDEEIKGDVYVVFDGRQVKHASKNNGMYGQATKNMFKQSANPVLAKEEQLRQEFKQKIIDAHRSEDEAEQLSHIYIAANRYFSKYSGIPLDKIIQADNLSTEVVPSTEGNRGRTLFYREETDIFGNIIQEAKTILQLTNEADKSTALHELGHIFLDKFRRLAASGMLKGRANQDWQTLVKTLKLEGIDFSQELSVEDKRTLSNAHEEFAVSFEKYLMTGKAPTSKLKHVFEAFKRWLTDIYHSIRDILYAGSDGQLHTFELSPKVREVFDSMLSVDSSSDGSVSNDESLIAPDEVEQYNQRTYYASGTPLEGDKFDFKKMRQSKNGYLLDMGPAWGVTTTQTRFDAKKHRTENASLDKRGHIHFRNRSGKDAHEAVRNFKNKEYREAAEWVLLDLERRVDRDTTPEEFDAIKANLLETYQRVGAADKIHFIKQIDRMTVDKNTTGSLYIVDSPDDDLLLDGDLPMAKQSERIKEAVKGIQGQLKIWGVSLWSGEKRQQTPPRQGNLFSGNPEAWNASMVMEKNGLDFYRALSKAMQTVIDRTKTKITSPKYGVIDNPDMAASIILNRFGVPGLRVKQGNFYTYTTWNEDMLRVLGVSKDSDNDTAREFARQEEAQKKQQRREQIERSQPSKIAQFLGRERLLQEGQVNINLYGGDRGTAPSKHRVTIDLADESYDQIGGKIAAERLDRAEGVTTRMDNLKIAEKMTKAGKDAKTIWLATGWQADPNGDWQYELLDGEIKPDLVLKGRIDKSSDKPMLCAKSTLGKILVNAEEIFTAYPELRKMPIEFIHTDHITDGYYSPKSKSIGINGYLSNDGKNFHLKAFEDAFITSLIHEMQHAVQDIEGFADGTSPATITKKRYNNSIRELQEQIAKLDSKENQEEIVRLKQQIAALEQERDDVVDHLVDNPLDADEDIMQQYYNSRGEIQARNAEHRYYLSSDETRNTPLSNTEDTYDRRFGTKRKERREQKAQQKQKIWIENSRGEKIYTKEDGTPFKDEFEASMYISELLDKLMEEMNRTKEIPEIGSYDYKVKSETLSENDADESYQQIGAKRKKDMDAALTRQRPDMSPEQRAEAISEIEKLGESVRQGGNPKVEKAATHWLLKGHIILPEDNYKIVDAVKICEQQHIDPMGFDDPNTILAKYTIKETAASKRINPDTVPEFSDKKTYDNGITVYTIEDTREGQQAVRRIIDTHWGEDANPWCLAARQNGTLDEAWEYWSETYNATDKRIAFKDGKLLAFSASNDEVTWWDREDQPHSEILYTVKEKGKSTTYSLNEKTGKMWRKSETLSDGTQHEWHNNEKIKSETLPDGTRHEWDENGIISKEMLPDGTRRTWYRNKVMSLEQLPDGTAHLWYENKQMESEKLPDGTWYNWHDNGKMAFAKLPNGKYYKWAENGHLKSITIPNGAEYPVNREYTFYSDGSDSDGHLSEAYLPGEGTFSGTRYRWDTDGQAKYVMLPDGTAYSWDNNGELSYVRFPDGTHYEPNMAWAGVFNTAVLSKNDIEKLNQDQQRTKQKAEQIRAELEQEITDEIQEAERIAQYKSDYESDYKPDEPESYKQAAYSPRGFMRKIFDKVTSTAKKMFTPSVKSTPNIDAESLHFANEETERRYRDSLKGVQQLGLLGKIKHSTMGLIRSMKGDFPELSGDAMKFAKEQFRMLQRKKSSQVKQAMQTFTENLRGLDTYQRDLFGRKRLLDDLMWRKKNYPDAELPFGFTDEMLKKEAERFDKLVKGESAVTQAIKREEQTMQNISNEFIALAKDLGLNLEGVLRNPHYYRHTILEYANAAAMGMPRSVQKSNASLQDFVDSQLRGITGRGYLKRYKGSPLDISTNYVQANGEVRAQMLMDIEVMKALGEIKKKYDIAPKLRQKLQRALRQQTDIETHSQPSTEDQTISDIIPDGYTLYDPAGSRLIQSANSSAENIISMAVDDAARQSGLPLDRLLRSLGSLGEDAFNRLLVIPNEIANALDNMSKDRDRGMLGNAAKVLTNWWKKAVLFSPTRNIKYNFRNFTGDLDALIAGNPKALKFFPQAVRELTAHYRGKNTTSDLQDYIDRSGGLNIDSMQITTNEADALQEIAETQPASLGKRGWNLVKKFFRNEVAFTAWRENLLRYTAYLSYKQDMEQNNGTPSSWGASIKDEVMSIEDIRDRAYKMSNELLGAYDQISEFGRQLRDLAIPFWSWSEINLKRYYRLLKNGLTGQNSSDFAKRFMLAKSARVPFYAISAAETFAKISLFTMLAQMFNRFVMPDDDDELPPDIKNKPHITLGKVKGQVYYFDRIGALGDAAEWLGLDNIVMDTQQMRRGSMPFAEFMKKVITAPAGKVLQEVNPLFRMPYELATGRTIYPDVSHPRMIRDNGAYISQTFGLSWPYKAATGKPRSDWDEFKNMFVYSADAEEAAYFYSLDMVRQFQERVLGKRFDGFAQTKRGQALQKLKAALRFNDKVAIKQSLREYAALDGTPQGLKASMKSMNPLYGLSKDEQKKFMRWISQEDRKYLRKANTYYHRLADKYIR